jgi:predicted negative regulator of RcsB-dependent stress response
MTKPKTKTPAALAADDLDVESLMDTIITRRRELSIGAIAVAAVAGGLLLWRLSVNQKNERGDQALNEATNALYAGNRPLAATELQAIADRYRDTAAGVEGAMILAQLDFEDARWADGLKVLEAIKVSSAIGSFRAPVDGLMGGAYADLKKYDDAVKHYQAAADESNYQSAKDVYQADAARILALAGKKDEARKIWQDLISRPESPAVAEAKVRLGELDAAPATRN